MKNSKILIIDDNQMFCNNLSKYLSIKAKYICDIANNAIEAIEKIKTYKYDLITLDIELDDVNGIDLLQQIKKNYTGPVIFISCLNDIDTKLNGLKKGGDDYLTKPIEMEELYIRAQKLINRVNANRFIKLGDYVIDEENRVAYHKDKKLILNEQGFGVLALLLKNPGKVYSREALFALIWNSDYSYSSRVIDVAIVNVRKETGDKRIKTVYGVGYTYE